MRNGVQGHPDGVDMRETCKHKREDDVMTYNTKSVTALVTPWRYGFRNAFDMDGAVFLPCTLRFALHAPSHPVRQHVVGHTVTVPGFWAAGASSRAFGCHIISHTISGIWAGAAFSVSYGVFWCYQRDCYSNIES